MFEVQPPEVTITVTNNSLTVEVSELETFILCRCVQMSVHLFMYMYMYMNALHVHVCSLPFLCVSLCSLHLRSKDSPCRGRFYSPKRYLQAAQLTHLYTVHAVHACPCMQGEGVGGAKVYVNGHLAATTDTTGTYSLSNITSGSYHLLVSCID